MRTPIGVLRVKFFVVVAVVLVHGTQSATVTPEDRGGSGAGASSAEHDGLKGIDEVEPAHGENEVSRKKKEEKGIMSKILPYMVIPFMVSTAMIPKMLLALKFMLLKSILIGKIAWILLFFTMWRRRQTSGEGGVFEHVANVRDAAIPMAHYGYNGDEEYGAYVNRRKRLAS